MSKKLIVIVLIIFFVSSIGFGGYIIYLKKKNAELLEENYYYLNRSFRAENDIKGISYLLITTEINLRTIDSVLSKHSDINSYIEIPPHNFIRKTERQLMSLTLEFTSDSILNVITFCPLLPIYSNNYLSIEDTTTLKIKRLK